MKCQRIKGENNCNRMENERWMYVVICKKNSSEVIRAISEYFRNKPRFIKRIWPDDEFLRVLLCKTAEYSTEMDSLHLASLGIDTSALSEVDIPNRPPETEEEVLMWQSKWPCTVQNVAPKYTDLPEEIEEIINKNIQVVSKEECASISIILGKEGMYTIFTGINQNISVFNHPIVRMVQNTSRSTEDYLCTGTTVILSGEPCLVCGMALIHGRVRRIYIAGKRSEDSPYTKYGVHENKSLNHRIEVYMVSQSDTVETPDKNENTEEHKKFLLHSRHGV